MLWFLPGRLCNGDRNDPPTGTRSNKRTQRKSSGLRFSTHRTQGDREEWKTCTSLPARGAGRAQRATQYECGCSMKVSVRAVESSIQGQEKKLREGLKKKAKDNEIEQREKGGEDVPAGSPPSWAAFPGHGNAQPWWGTGVQAGPRPTSATGKG